MTVRVGINGFGRIGRSFFRALLERGAESGVELVAVNDPFGDAATMAFLLKHDSVGGRLANEVKATDAGFSVDGTEIKKLDTREPSEIPWAAEGVDVVIESTGLFTARDKAAAHLEGGAKRVVISAPSGDADATICMGVNDDVFDPKTDTVVSNASCTTNCLAPMAKVLEDSFGIEHGFITTVHAYTTDQQLQDQATATRGGKADLRRMRAAGDRCGVAAAQGPSRRPRVAGADAGRIDHRPGGHPEVGGIGRRRERGVRHRGQRCVLPGCARDNRRAPRISRHRGKPVVVHLLGSRHDGCGQHREGTRLVRQRVGLFEPSGRSHRVHRRSVTRAGRQLEDVTDHPAP